ncbi:hypothetical protein HK104_006019, partial [Borealophlyctis nickersoniae]
MRRKIPVSKFKNFKFKNFKLMDLGASIITGNQNVAFFTDNRKAALFDKMQHLLSI